LDSAGLPPDTRNVGFGLDLLLPNVSIVFLPTFLEEEAGAGGRHGRQQA